MKYKKTMILLVLAIFIFGVASVCASDVNDTVIAREDDSIVELSQADADEIMLTDENELISQTDNGLISEGKSGTFAELQINITQATEGSTLTLNKNYECEDDFDSGGILINKSITIDGQGNKIDAQGKSRIFNITAENVILKNIIFTNGKTTERGGAVFFNGTGNVTNCNFVDNKATGDYSYGGAIRMSSGTVTNCNFTGNTATVDGGAVYISSTGNVTNCNFTDNSARNGGAISMVDGTVSNCNFTNNTANRYGGAINMGDGTVSNCNFTNNSATYDGGAIIIYSGTVSNCNFTDNSATENGGAVYFVDSGTVSNCNFTNNSATYDGGAVYFSGTGTGTVSNCNFTNNTANRDGGAVYFSGTGNVTNCNFVDNKATGDYSYGGAVYFRGTGNVTNCNFTNNKATGNYSCGGAIRMSSGTVANCNFTGNSARNGGAVYISSNGIVSNCNFTNNSATENGGAVYFSEFYYNTVSVTKCNFTDNTATRYGGAIYFSEGYYTTVSVTNCNFTNNTASEWGGAVYFVVSGTVSNCNFTNNSARYGGAVEFKNSGTVSSCNFTNNKATRYGGAIFFEQFGKVTNCNFTDNEAYCSGAVFFNNNDGEVTNCNFVDNTATGDGGAIKMVSGTVSSCNFTGNNATGDGGAINMGSGSVTNCNFTGNNATGDGGAVYFDETGTVTNCNFTGNNATTGSAIYFYKYFSSDTLTVSNSTFLNNRANAGALDIVKTENNITITFTGQNNLLNAIYSIEDAEVTFTNVTYWGANGIATVSATMSGSNKAAGQNITVGVVVNDKLVLNDVIITNETGTIVLNISAGENYYISARHNTDSYYTEAETTISNNTKFNVNVTSQTTTNKTVNITAKSNIYSEFMPGKLLFILPNNVEINATYGGNGTWWAVHTFDDYGVYQVNASYTGLSNVTITNATITINKLNSTVNLDDVVLTYGETKNVTVITEGATGITATINNNPVTVINNFTIMISGLAAGNYTLTVTTIPDGDHNSVNKTVKVTVNKAHTEITINTTSLELFVGDETIILATLSPAGAGNVTFTSSNKDIVEVDDKGNIIAQGKGQAIINVSFAGDNNYTAAENKTVTINVSLADASVTVDKNNLDLKIGETYAINATKHPDTILLDITYKSSNNAVATVDKNGIVTAVGEGTAIITVEVGDDILYAINSTNVTVTVSKISTGIASSAVTTVYNIEKNLIVTLKDADGKPISGAKITVDLSGAKTYTTDNNGQVKVSTKGLAAKTYTAKITFKGNEKYKQSTKDVKVTVKKATPKLTAKKKTFKTKTKTKKYTIVLKDNTGKAMKKVKVTLKVKGKTYKATTNSKGKATFKIKNLKKKGTFKAVITYKGNKNYNKVTKKVKIKVIVTFKTVSQGSKDKSTVKDIQRALKDHGYYLTYDGHYLMIDGKYNSCTVKSIKEFQHDKGLKVTGKVDEKTARKLGLI